MNESGRQKGNETERDTETRKQERERERRGPGGGRNLRAPPFRMQIQEHLEAKVACKSALCSHLIGARAAAPRANTCFLQPLKNRVAYFSLFFSLSPSFFSPPSPPLPSSLCFPSPFPPKPFRPAIALYRLTISGNTDRPEYIFTRIARRSGTLFADKRNDFHGKYQTGPVYRGWKRERERKRENHRRGAVYQIFSPRLIRNPSPETPPLEHHHRTHHHH